MLLPDADRAALASRRAFSYFTAILFGGIADHRPDLHRAVRYVGASSSAFFRRAACSSALSLGGAVRLPTGSPTAARNPSWPAGAQIQSIRTGSPDLFSNRLWGIGRNVDGRRCLDGPRRTAKCELDLAMDHLEHFFEIVPVRGRPGRRLMDDIDMIRTLETLH